MLLLSNSDLEHFTRRTGVMTSRYDVFPFSQVSRYGRLLVHARFTRHIPLQDGLSSLRGLLSPTECVCVCAVVN